MPTFVALLRGINVGKAKRLAMADLRSVLSGLGYTGVATLLNSGNAVFQSPGNTPTKHATDIGTALSTQLGFEVQVIVKSTRDLAAIVSENPIRARGDEHPRLLVAFVQDPRTLSSLAPVGSLVAPPEQFRLGRRAAYLLCGGGGMMQSKAAEALLGKIGRSATTRNWATVLKLQALADRRGT